MSYITQADLEARYGSAEISKLAAKSSVDKAIADSQAMIDSYIGVVAELPLVTIPAALVAYACDIARYKLYGDLATEEVRARYKDAIQWLQNVAAGKALLNIETGTDTTLDGIVVKSRKQVYTDGLMETY